MKKTVTFGVLGGSALLVAGCAVPVPLQVASWALDGISFLTTEKSMTDHGLSMVTQQDCAVWRGVTEGDLCKDWDSDDESLLASLQGAGKDEALDNPKTPVLVASFAPAARSDIPPLATELDDGLPNVEELANFETAAGPAESLPVASMTRPMAMMVSVPVRLAPRVKAATAVQSARPAAKRAQQRAMQRVRAVSSAAIRATYRQRVTARVNTVAKVIDATVPKAVAVVVKQTTRKRVTVPAVLPQFSGDEPRTGVYFVVGSFRNYGNARDFAGRYEGLVPEVLAAKLDGAPVYRVVVGPVIEGRERVVHRRLSHSGIRNSWAIRVLPGDWMIARSVINDKRRAGLISAEGTQLARSVR